MDPEDVNRILLQGQESMLHLLCTIFQNELILIEQIRSGKSRPEALVVIAQNVQSGLYTIDALGDGVRELLQPHL